MRKSIFSILLCFIMAVGMFPTAAVAETAPEFKAEDLESINIPDTLVTVRCTTTGDSKTYGAIDGGFDTDKATPYLDSEDNVYKVIVSLKLSAYKNQYDTDTGAEHVVSGIGSTVITFKLKYVDSAWMIEGNFPSVPIFVTCGGHATSGPPTDGGHENQQPEIPMYPTNDSISGLGDNIVGVVCMNAPDKTKFYGLINGGFTSTKPEFNFKTGAYESTITLIPSVYCSQYSTDTGIEHQVNPNQTTEGLSFVVRYDLEKNMWMPTEEVKQMGIWVKCDNHEVQQPEIPMYPTNDSISGLGDNIVGVVCMNAPDKTKFYGLINGGFTSTKPEFNFKTGAYESTITLIPSVYCSQYSTDTGIEHQVNPNQTTEGLSFVVRYDLEKNMWMPTEEVKQMGIWVICDKHEGGNGGTTDPGTTPGGNTGPGGTTDPGTTPGGSTDPDTTPGGNDGNTKPDNKPGDNGNNQGSDKSGTDPVDNAPQTEDISNMSLWLAIMLLNIGALLGTVVFIRKHKRV